jgi:hypothetical protein
MRKNFESVQRFLLIEQKIGSDVTLNLPKGNLKEKERKILRQRNIRS